MLGDWENQFVKTEIRYEKLPELPCLKLNSVALHNSGTELQSFRGSPIGFSGSGIWLILRSGFGIFGEKGSEIRDCRYERDAGFGNFTKRDSENIAFKNRDRGSPVTKCTKKIRLSSS